MVNIKIDVNICDRKIKVGTIKQNVSLWQFAFNIQHINILQKDKMQLFYVTNISIF